MSGMHGDARFPIWGSVVLFVVGIVIPAILICLFGIDIP